MKNLMLMFLCLCQFSVLSAVYTIGSDKDYPSPNALYVADVLTDGDTILIDGGDYVGQETLANWSSNNLLIRGVNGRPHLEANGEYIQGKGIWVVSGNNIIIENIEFSGAVVPDQNGAGIRAEGISLTISKCYFHDNENGILSSSPFAGHILIEYTEFGYNGYGDGQSHNLYINHVDTLTFQFNYSHHAIIGHCIKSRADNNFILYNRIMDEEDGNSSRLIDLPSGGLAIIMGNTLMQGPNAENNNLIGYGLEGLVNDEEHQLYVINNTLVSTRSTGLFFHIAEGAVGSAINNILAGKANLAVGNLDVNAANVINENIDAIGFKDIDNFDYRLEADASPVDMGIDAASVLGFELYPLYEYVHPTNGRDRIVIDAIDVGAFEAEDETSTIDPQVIDFSILPNPASEVIRFSNEISDVQVVDDMSRVIRDIRQPTLSIEISNLQQGIYYLIKDGQCLSKFIKI